MLQQIIRFNQSLLASAGLLPESQPGLRVAFDWPLRAIGSAAQGFGVHGISNFVDLDPAFPGSLLDYNCGARSYDTTGGYNHQGIDIFTWPFPWRWMDANEVQLVAAAPGTIVFKSDGNLDESCGFGGGNWNAVYVQHLDGSVAWYGHMKKNSLTSKAVGQTVATGEYLGVVGSSGNSTGPHLHFEVYDNANNLIEPFAGPCNYLTPRSWWRSQRPYYDSAINRLQVGNAPVTYSSCPGRVVTNESAVTRGTLGYFTAFYRDQLNSQTSTYRIRRPNGSIFRTWTHASPAAHYAASWWWWSWSISLAEPAGTWTFQVVYDGQTYSYPFSVN